MRRIISLYIVCSLLMITSCKREGELKLFTELSSGDTGIKFKNLVRESEEFNVVTYGYYYQGGRVAIGDVNNDSLPDIYFTGNMMASKLYINKGDWELAGSDTLSAALLETVYLGLCNRFRRCK